MKVHPRSGRKSSYRKDDITYFSWTCVIVSTFLGLAVIAAVAAFLWLKFKYLLGDSGGSGSSESSEYDDNIVFRLSLSALQNRTSVYVFGSDMMLVNPEGSSGDRLYFDNTANLTFIDENQVPSNSYNPIWLSQEESSDMMKVELDGHLYSVGLFTVPISCRTGKWRLSTYVAFDQVSTPSHFAYGDFYVRDMFAEYLPANISEDAFVRIAHKPILILHQELVGRLIGPGKSIDEALLSMGINSMIEFNTLLSVVSVYTGLPGYDQKTLNISRAAILSTIAARMQRGIRIWGAMDNHIFNTSAMRTSSSLLLQGKFGSTAKPTVDRSNIVMPFAISLQDNAICDSTLFVETIMRYVQCHILCSQPYKRF
jgi:hypothetical protein